MDSKQIEDYLKNKYPWSFCSNLSKLIIVYINKKIKFYIGKVLFFDTDSMGIRIIGGTDCIIYNFNKYKVSSNNINNIVIINPEKLSDNIFDNCNKTIYKIIDEENHENSYYF